MPDIKEMMKFETIELREDRITRAHYGKFSIEPLESGWGVTLGNAIRRVLLSSMEGAAVTSVEIDNVIHEFSSLPGMREDITDLLLNIKGIVLSSSSPEEEVLRIDVRGNEDSDLPRRVTARDIQPNPNVEIINPDHYLAELNHEGQLAMTLYVNHGKGYQETSEKIARDYRNIQIDAIFTPVRKVNYSIVDTRVGQFTNFDKLVLEIWTNGSILPQEALKKSLDLLVGEITYIYGLVKESMSDDLATPVDVALEENEMGEDKLIEELELSVRAYNCLKRARINTLRELLEIINQRPEDLKKIKNLGQKTYEEIVEKVEKLGFELNKVDVNEVNNQ
ncbi:MAG TPA: DNA-directed RNA polymerase subunit alpha [Atribacter sp.]|jgi:DNA-directed RNA polymerase subunit alpha|uniref:DNA-directed RNA polymerase subunit alpha n=1 Tax=Candidatus Atribacter allofermentans TaxID=1852833 RepID=A0A1V5T431_9BACT|nr:DNA-directed RNA polymerase subunit alpha [Atribacter sp.]MDI9593984.1 DNA-directed RNA polymerase subunit alpha [Atribacterota bacterium]OQA61526.1 MAG: DNA-directed RNA polymerase subunit alpha [Candidatus Atribacteria bacterium ADurb.Bin276]HHT11089.1 DNA-directed RNA polymerase subunit alpha [Candidatus Atribacteria bacterium]HOT04885.1 DNA-directed RNA polymerase subunit alpha [Atribacter sp.]HQK84083.1 DNA-directed RNA polymerase subunit alpha [Atribacter sp.]